MTELIVEAKPSPVHPTLVSNELRTAEDIVTPLRDSAITGLLKRLVKDAPTYPHFGRKGDIEHFSDVIYHDIWGGGDLIDVTHYDSKDFEHRKKVAREQKRRRVIENLDAYSRRIGFSVMDVEGKGPEALYNALIINGVMKAHNNRDFERVGEVSPHAIEHLNDHFHSIKGKRTSFIYGEVTDPKRGMRDERKALCKFISAGGLPPVIYRVDLRKFDTEVKKNWVPGWLIGVARSDKLLDKAKSSAVMKEAYVINEFNLSPGDIGMFFTDGYSELGAKKDLRYPLTQSEDIMRRLNGAPLPELYNALISDRIDYPLVPVSDDIGMLLVRYSPKKSN